MHEKDGYLILPKVQSLVKMVLFDFTSHRAFGIKDGCLRERRVLPLLKELTT